MTATAELSRYQLPPDPDADEHRRILSEALGHYTSPRATKPSRAERIADWVEDVEWLINNGECVAAISQHMGLTVSSIAKKLDRAGRVDLARQFWRFA